MKEIKNNYSAKDIQVLEGLEPVRIRPGMYIGSTGSSGLHHMIWEIIDNSIDEAMAGYADQIEIVLTKKGSVWVKDNGRGIPVEKHEKTNKSTVETVLTTLHAGGKFDNNSYKVSGGLHGVGASVVNGLSKWFKTWVYRNNQEYFIEFKDGGKPVSDLKITNKKAPIKNGTIIEFYPDFTIMDENEYDEEIIKNRLKQLAYLNKKIVILFRNEKGTNKVERFFSEGGIKEWISELNKEKELLIPNIISGEKKGVVKSLNKENNWTVVFEFAFQYNTHTKDTVYAFCNNIHTTEGGSHEESFKYALQKTINDYAVEKNLLKDKEERMTKEDVLEGISAIISLKHPNPQYEGQTKKKLGNSEVRQFILKFVNEAFRKYLLENPQDAKNIVNKCLAAMDNRKKTELFRENIRRKSPFESNALPGKLADCTIKNREISELYIVEGDSAGGSAKLGRNRFFQAILPLRGKVINVEKNKSEKVLENEEIKNLTIAIGIGLGNNIDLNNLRYNKIILMTDADVDGSHIRILLLTFFFRYMRPLIENGNVYIAQPPLYKFSVGKKNEYVYDEKTLENWKKKYANTNSRFQIQRYKGLGEMNPQQLWETTMKPENRTLLKVEIDDAIKVDQTFEMLMGEAVEPRKKFIQENSQLVKNLDI